MRVGAGRRSPFDQDDDPSLIVGSGIAETIDVPPVRPHEHCVRNVYGSHGHVKTLIGHGVVVDSTQASFAALKAWHNAIQAYSTAARAGSPVDRDRLAELQDQVEQAKLHYRAAQAGRHGEKDAAA